MVEARSSISANSSALLSEEVILKIQECGRKYREHSNESEKNRALIHETRDQFFSTFFGECDKEKRKAMYKIADASLIKELDQHCPHVRNELFPSVWGTMFSAVEGIAKNTLNLIQAYVISHMIGDPAVANMPPPGKILLDTNPEPMVQRAKDLSNIVQPYLPTLEEFKRMVGDKTSVSNTDSISPPCSPQSKPQSNDLTPPH